jgi:hypothetical protein
LKALAKPLSLAAAFLLWRDLSLPAKVSNFDQTAKVRT